MKRWELKNKSAGGKAVAAVDLHGAKWMPKLISVDGKESATGLPVNAKAAKSAAAQRAFNERGWQSVDVAEAVESQSVEEAEIAEVEFA